MSVCVCACVDLRQINQADCTKGTEQSHNLHDLKPFSGGSSWMDFASSDSESDPKFTVAHG